MNPAIGKHRHFPQSLSQSKQLPLVKSNADQVIYKSEQHTLLDAFAITLTSFLPDKKLYNNHFHQL